METKAIKALKRKQKCIEAVKAAKEKRKDGDIKKVSKRSKVDDSDQLSSRPDRSKDFSTGLGSGDDDGIDSSAKTTRAHRENDTASISSTHSQIGVRLDSGFYEKTCVDLSKSLLGQILVRKLKDGTRVSGKIVETEAYCGIEDKAAHSYKGKRTEKTEAMFMKPGTAYVYNIYGMYCCINISSQGEGCAVLLRAMEPAENIDRITILRSEGKKSPGKTTLKDHQLANGPSKICMALGIKKAGINKQDMTVSDQVWLEKGKEVPPCYIVTTTRINISYGEEWVDKPLRFYVLDNKSVSVRDKQAENDVREKLGK